MIVAALAGLWRGDTPVDLGRDEARELARRELAKPAYDRDRPFLERAIDWIVEQLDRLLSSAAGTISSGYGAAILVALVVAVVVVVIVRTGPLSRRAKGRRQTVFPDARRTAAEYRAAADRAARDHDWATAVVERFRAIVARLEEDGVLEPRTALTADEAAREAGASFPAQAGDLDRAAAVFDAVLYGEHAADAGDDDHLRRLDDELARTRPRHDPQPEQLAVPR